MKFALPTDTLEVVPNLAWIQNKKVVICLFSLRYPEHIGTFGCYFEKAIKIVQEINNKWNVNTWCFDWSAERDLVLSNNKDIMHIFDVMEQFLLCPLKSLLPANHKFMFMHGDANLSTLHEVWRDGKSIGFDEIVHYNRFLHHYNKFYPSAKPEMILRGAYTTFNRKHTPYREKLLSYLKNNQLLDKGYVNFHFENISTLLEQLEKDYETNESSAENQIYRYYRVTNFDIIIETATHQEENQCFLTEKTMRALALGQPFVTYNGTGSLKYLHNLGFKSYGNIWDESYDKIQDNDCRFDAVMAQAHHLITNTSMFADDRIKEINKHNQLLFQRLAKYDHKEMWLRSKS